MASEFANVSSGRDGLLKKDGRKVGGRWVGTACVRMASVRMTWNVLECQDGMTWGQASEDKTREEKRSGQTWKTTALGETTTLGGIRESGSQDDEKRGR